VESYDAALAFLYRRIDYERTASAGYGTREFKLDRMRQLLARMGNPQEQLTIVHVAGTKGKGSTAAMISAVLSAAGYRVGMFTSPHLERLEERIAIDGRPCSAEEIVALVERLRPVVGAMDGQATAADPAGGGPTFFEITTAMALLHFASERTDLAVLEVGLGGRLDCTNVCSPAVSVVTSISYDHTDQLGNTLAEIAAEKAGIIKPGVDVVSGVTGREPRDVIEQTCRRLACPLVQLGRDFRFSYRPPTSLELAPGSGQFDYGTLRDLSLGLLGEHQAANAAVAIATVDRLRARGVRVDDDAIRRGLAGVRWPARVEVVARRPAVVVDSAHNVASVEALLRVLAESFTAPRRVLVFATTEGKDIRGMLSRLLPVFDDVVLTRYSCNPRAVSLAKVEQAVADVASQRRLPAGHLVCPDAAAAWQEAHRLAGPRDLICITGSIFIAAEMRTLAGAGGG